MKKLLTILVASILCICCVGLAACNTAAGTYKIKSMTTAGITVEVGEKLDADYIKLELEKDGVAKMTTKTLLGSVVKEGTWEQKGKTVTITIGDEPQEYTLDGDTLTYTNEDSGMVLQKVD